MPEEDARHRKALHQLLFVKTKQKNMNHSNTYTYKSQLSAEISQFCNSQLSWIRYEMICEWALAVLYCTVIFMCCYKLELAKYYAIAKTMYGMPWHMKIYHDKSAKDSL